MKTHKDIVSINNDYECQSAFIWNAYKAGLSTLEEAEVALDKVYADYKKNLNEAVENMSWGWTRETPEQENAYQGRSIN